MNFKIAAGLFICLMAFTKAFGASVAPLTVNPESRNVQFDLQSFHEWRVHVQKKDLPEEELIRFYAEFISSTVFEGLIGFSYDVITHGNILQGKMSDDEFYLITRAVTRAIERIETSFPRFPIPLASERQSSGICRSILCLDDINRNMHLKTESSPAVCLDKITLFHPLAGEKTQTIAYQPLVVFYRSGKLIGSLNSRDDYLTFASKYPGEVVTLKKFIAKYVMKDSFCAVDFTSDLWKKLYQNSY